mmetsp:Transcript_1231/g.1644  ORF Transcript_1231/g.1644 Transcript_1231/m.1644 type:complete len:104 (-) Transcript_1231:142-453(-)
MAPSKSQPALHEDALKPSRIPPKPTDPYKSAISLQQDLQIGMETAAASAIVYSMPPMDCHIIIIATEYNAEGTKEEKAFIIKQVSVIASYVPIESVTLTSVTA